MLIMTTFIKELFLRVIDFTQILLLYSKSISQQHKKINKS